MIARSRASYRGQDRKGRRGNVVFCKASVYYAWESHALEKIAFLLWPLCFIRT